MPSLLSPCSQERPVSRHRCPLTLLPPVCLAWLQEVLPDSEDKDLIPTPVPWGLLAPPTASPSIKGRGLSLGEDILPLSLRLNLPPKTTAQSWHIVGAQETETPSQPQPLRLGLSLLSHHNSPMQLHRVRKVTAPAWATLRRWLQGVPGACPGPHPLLRTSRACPRLWMCQAGHWEARKPGHCFLLPEGQGAYCPRPEPAVSGDGAWHMTTASSHTRLSEESSIAFRWWPSCLFPWAAVRYASPRAHS